MTEAPYEMKYLSVPQQLKSATRKPWNMHMLTYQPMRPRDRATKRYRASEPLNLMSIYGHLYSKGSFQYS